MGGFVALAALMAGLLRDFKRDTRRQFDDLRAEFREAHAQTNRRIDDLRAEVREAYAQTNRRIDDLRATVVAIIPRAAAEPVAAPPVHGDKAREATAAAGDPQQPVVEPPAAPRAARRPPDKA